MSDSTPAGGPDDHFAPPPPPTNTDYRHARWHRQVRHWPPSPAHRAHQETRYEYTDPRQVVIVGVCSAGKSTLMKRLREKGYRTRTCAQEHSGVPRLWERLAPDVLIYLDASLSTIRGRGRSRWQPAALEAQRDRLEHARHHCDLYVHTDGLTPADVASRALTFLSNSRRGA